MITGSCHCGQVAWTFDGVPASATSCNCSVCRRYGTLWAYGHDGETIRVSGPTRAYVHGDRTLGFHFCGTCGCVAYWRGLLPGKEGRHRIAVNLRLAEPAAVTAIPLVRFDGLHSFSTLGQDGRAVGHIWF